VSKLHNGLKLAPLFVFLLFSRVDSAQAKMVAPLLRCLGQEELRLHRRHSKGPVYILNQTLINHISGANQAKLKHGVFEEVCQHPYFPPSVAMLKILLIRGLDIFILKITKDNTLEMARMMATLHELEDNVPQIFFRYLTHLQGLASDPHCLEKAIPDLSHILIRFRYLEGDYSSKFLLRDKKRISRIFKKLRQLKKILKKCRH